MKGEIYKDRGSKWRWRLKTANGRIVACSGESFCSKSNANRALKKFTDTSWWKIAWCKILE